MPEELFEAARSALENLRKAVGADFDDREGDIGDMIHELTEMEGALLDDN
jgi:hypothetical protein